MVKDANLKNLSELKKKLPHSLPEYQHETNDKEIVEDFIKSVKRNKGLMEFLKKLGNE